MAIAFLIFVCVIIWLIARKVLQMIFPPKVPEGAQPKRFPVVLSTDPYTEVELPHPRPYDFSRKPWAFPRRGIFRDHEAAKIEYMPRCAKEDDCHCPNCYRRHYATVKSPHEVEPVPEYETA